MFVIQSAMLLNVLAAFLLLSVLRYCARNVSFLLEFVETVIIRASRTNGRIIFADKTVE